jgi:lysophospholipase L1-like esterase
MMTRLVDYRFFTALTLAAIAGVVSIVPARAQSAAQPVACTAPGELTRFARPLNRTARRLAAGKPITIVAIGSSSTAGAGASSAAASYPSRLAAELKGWFPSRTITVINHGINGAEVGDMLAKFEENVAADKPDLVLWQLGTNSLLRDRTLSEAAVLINKGLGKLKALGADVILLNPQYAPRVIAKAEAEHMIKIIAMASNQENVNLFDRFAVMKRWRVAENIPFSVFLSPDELHMNDWSYACVAKLLGGAIAEAASRPAQTAIAR